MINQSYLNALISKLFVFVLIIISFNQGFAADGSINAVNDNTVTVSMNQGVFVNPGDELIVSLDLGGEVLTAGKIRVDNVKGHFITARIIEKQMAVQKGMIVTRIMNALLTETDKSIQTRLTTHYSLVWTDKGSGARTDFATFRPIAEEGYYPLGDVVVTGPWDNRGRYAPPSVNSLLVKDGVMVLAKPIGYSRTWDSRGSRPDVDFSTWLPIPPPGYACLGEVGVADLDTKPPVDAIRCIPDSCVAQVPLGDMLWKDSGSGAKLDYSAWAVPGLTTYIGYASHRKPNRSAYSIKQECIN